MCWVCARGGVVSACVSSVEVKYSLQEEDSGREDLPSSERGSGQGGKK